MFVDKAKIFVKGGDGGDGSLLSVVRSMYPRVDLQVAMEEMAATLFSV